MTLFIILIVVNYLVGGIPFSYIIGRLNGVDIRREGSGNVGGTNVLRVCGKKAGAWAFFLDISKGAVSALYTTVIIFHSHYEESFLGIFLTYLAYVAPIVGHVYTPFLGFRGGKGVATSAGIFLILSPVAFFCGAVIFFSFVRLTRVVSISSICSALFFPNVVALQVIFPQIPLLSFRWGLLKSHEVSFLISAYLLALFITFLHRKNLEKLFSGKEFEFRKRT